jgi:hypothetical protein
MNAREKEECYRRWQSYESPLFPAIAALPIGSREQRVYVSRLSSGALRNLLDELRAAALFDAQSDDEVVVRVDLHIYRRVANDPLVPAHVSGMLRKMAGVTRGGTRAIR